MARADRREGDVAGVGRAVETRFARLALWAFGDRTGGSLFLGSLVVYTLGWQAGITILDTYAVANGMVAVADGHLHVDTVAFGPGFETPGMSYVDGRYYARNYGQVVAALPVYWLLEGLDAVSELRVAIAGLWSLCLVAFASTLATLRDDRRILAGGALAALGVFLLNLREPTPVPAETIPLLALQLVVLAGAALTVVMTYRLLSRVRSRRAGILGGALVAVGTPVAFWAHIPKRHTLATAVVLTVAYLLFRSRATERATPWNPTTLRAGMYALVGLFAWVHAPIAVTLFLPLVAVDVTSAPSNTPRDIGVIAGAVALSLLPFLLTNHLISGNPVRPPRLLPAAESVSGSLDSAAGGSGGTGSDTSGGTTGGDDVPLLAPVHAAVGTIGPMVDRVLGVYWRGFLTVIGEPGRLSRVVVASTGEVHKTDPGSVQRASNLSMLESTPLLGATLALPAGAVLSRLRPGRSDATESDSASTDSGWLSPVDGFLLAVSVLLALVYLPRLPLQGQITMRYLTPLYPVAVYAVCRHRLLGGHLVDRLRTVAYAYEATVLLGVPAAFVAVTWLGLGEAATFDAVAGAGVVVGIAVSVVGAFVLATDRGGNVLAGLVGVAAGTTTGFVLLSQLVLFHYGVHLLPVVQVLTETIRQILVRMTV
jgi:hypothetical protein